MIVCPNCMHKEMVGAIFCNECGAQLIFSEGVTTTTIKPGTAGYNRVSAAAYAEGETSFPPQSASDVTSVSLNILAAGRMIPLNMVDEITLGRVSEGQPVVPDIDLTPYKAYEAGVSRMHASIRLMENSLTVTDLGSANGTRVNGQQITSHIPYPVKHGDILTLGKFKIQVLQRSP